MMTFIEVSHNYFKLLISALLTSMDFKQRSWTCQEQRAGLHGGKMKIANEPGPTELTPPFSFAYSTSRVIVRQTSYDIDFFFAVRFLAFMSSAV